MSLWSKLTGGIASFGIGAATADAVRPELEPLRQTAWANHPSRVLDPGVAAHAAAQRIETPVDLADDAAREGVGSARFELLAELARTVPGTAELLTLWRRNIIDRATTLAALGKLGYQDRFLEPLLELHDTLLSPAEVAQAVQQGHLPNDGILPEVSPAVAVAEGAVTPTAPDGQPPSTVPLTQIGLDPLEQAAGAGVSEAQLKVLANLAGLPPGADTVLQMWNRGLIDEETVDAGIREGHLKTKWAGAFKRMRWAVLGAAEYAGLHLRGWISQEEMYAGGALTGHTKSQMDALYLNRGRPIAPVQAFTAWAREAPHPRGLGYQERPGTFDRADFLRALQQSDVRTEYGPVLWELRYAYPPLFQLGRLAQAGALTEERAREILKKERYEPQDIDALATYWYRGTATTSKGLTLADLTAEYEGLTMTRAEYLSGLEELGYSASVAEGKARVSDAKRRRLARNQLINRAHNRFVGWRIDEPAARSALTSAGITDALQDELVQLWTLERDINTSELTAAQVRKAYKMTLMTQQQATAELEARGYSAADTATFLAE